MIKINSTVYFDPDTMSVHDKEFGKGEALTQSDVNEFKSVIYDLDCRVPSFVMIFDYLTWYKVDDILNNLEIHISKMKKIIS